MIKFGTWSINVLHIVSTNHVFLEDECWYVRIVLSNGKRYILMYPDKEEAKAAQIALDIKIEQKLAYIHNLKV